MNSITWHRELYILDLHITTGMFVNLDGTPTSLSFSLQETFLSNPLLMPLKTGLVSLITLMDSILARQSRTRQSQDT